MRSRLVALAFLIGPAPAFAAVLPQPGFADRHIQTAAYDPDQVVLLHGVLGYQLMLEFAPGERLESVSIGDALGWQVTPNRNANLLFLKPLARNAVTNMNVATNVRRYTFEMRVLPKGADVSSAPYVVRFTYPEVAVAVAEAPPPPAPEPPPEERNTAYRVTGSPENTPVKIFDDGQKTYFEWAASAAAPAIFAVSSDGRERLVNSGVRGRYTVVEEVAPKFMLRSGKLIATAVNQALVSAQAARKRERSNR